VTGPTGPKGFVQDFIMVYAQTSSGTNVNLVSGDAVPFSTIANQAPGTKMTLTPGSNAAPSATTGVVTINDTGFYQVTFGVLPKANATETFELRINDLTGVAGPVSDPFLVMDYISGAAGRYFSNLTVIINVTTKGTTLTVNTTSAVVLGTQQGATQKVYGYMTILKLQ
jgi:hypothetical protein